MKPAEEELGDLLLSVARRIADHQPVDWDRTGDAATPELSPRLARLRAIEELALAFAAAQPAATEEGSSPEPLFRWGHLEVREKIGEGSFGEVYRAYDQVLDREMALKLRRAGPSHESESGRRYLREARRLARVRHPNVLVVHGAGVHEGRVGLWTDLVTGETLAQLLARRGPLPALEVVAIGRDLTRALGAVHAAGLLHGDVKPDNVMRDGEGRIVLADFGGGAELLPGGEAGLLSRGTPVMLAPEVLRGEAPTLTADLYSLGVLLYRLLTGKYPVEGDDVHEIARRHEEGGAPTLRELSPALPEPLARLVGRLIDPDPRRRPASAAEVERELDALLPGASPRRRGWALVAGAAALALAVVVAYRLSEGLGQPDGPGTPAQPRPAVAVVVRTPPGQPESAWLGPALAEVLSAELSANESLRGVAGEQVARARRELSLAASGDLPAPVVRKLRQVLSADYVVDATAAVVPGAPSEVRFGARLLSTRTGETLLALEERDSQEDLVSLGSDVGRKLRKRLGVSSRGDSRALAAALPRLPAAARLYAEGLARLYDLDAPRAKRALERAVAAEPEFAPGHAALAAAWLSLGHDGKARREGAQAVALAAELPERTRRLIEGRWREASYQWPAAAAIHRSLLAQHPDDLDAGLRLAYTLTQANRGQEALDTIEALRRLPSPASESVWIDLMEATAAASLPADRRAQAAAARAVLKARASGARLLLARARLSEGWSWFKLDEHEAALLAAEEAASLFAALGDRADVAHAINLRGSVLKERGELAPARESYLRARDLFAAAGDEASLASIDYNLGTLSEREGDKAAARSQFEQSLALYRLLGHRRGEATALSAVGSLLRQAGDLAGAAAAYERALPLALHAGDVRSVLYLQNNVGNLRRDQGDLLAAQRSYEAGLVLAREVADRRGLSQLLHNLGGVRRLRGDLAGARVAYEEALALRRSAGEKGGMAGTLRGLAKVLLAQGDLAGARRLHEEALALRRELGEKGNVASSLMSLAEVALEEGRPELALSTLQGVAEEFRRQERHDEEAYAEATRARALVAIGNRKAARAASERALEAARLSGSKEALLTATIVSARLRAPEHGASCPAEPRAASEELAKVAAEASRSGHLALALEARLAHAEAALACVGGDAARTELATLQREAGGMGFRLLANHAAATLGSAGT